MQSLPKANKMDFIVHKATELGTCKIVPFLSSRSIPKLSPEKTRVKVSRWRNIAVQAARQCSGASIPEIGEIIHFEEAVSQPGPESMKLIFWEEETQKGIKEALCDARYNGVKDISVIVGPEGGFTREEVARATEKGFISVTLGKQVLKVDTAVLTILSIIQYEKGMFGED
jgi:16S rRNA (uracil1498-N3)-methyltransferase